MADEQKNSLDAELSDLFNEFEGSTENTEEQTTASEEPAPEEMPQQVEEAPASSPAPAAAKPLMGKKPLMPVKGGLRNPAAQTTARPTRPMTPQINRPGLGGSAPSRPAAAAPRPAGAAAPRPAGAAAPRPAGAVPRPAGAAPSPAAAAPRPAAAAPSAALPSSASAAKANTSNGGGGAPTILVVILLVLNVIMLAICGVLAMRMGKVTDELANLRNDTEMIKQRTAVQAGMAYLGPNKRPVRYMMILDYSDPHSPKLNPQKEITKPIE